MQAQTSTDGSGVHLDKETDVTWKLFEVSCVCVRGQTRSCDIAARCYALSRLKRGSQIADKEPGRDPFSPGNQPVGSILLLQTRVHMCRKGSTWGIPSKLASVAYLI